ncbi:glycoside hydrolase family 38 C-terminal domain-containing protein [candidate division KSB1 bacterium]
MNDKKLFLVCNAHLDPVWLWEWEEGLAETLSTFRTAAKFCREFDGFVFNHNESLLYEWIETYEPDLFEEIKELVREGKWHLMGGWYVQPDCNTPAGESFVRQCLLGKKFFINKLGAEPRTAVNLDPFGHSRGLVQILKKAGYTSYLFCRPDDKHLKLPSDDFIWTGFDGSEVLAHRASGHYNSERGRAAEKIKKWIEKNSALETGMLLWGIGNHGGGPSREDLTQIKSLNRQENTWNIIHGKPEDYFEWLDSKRDSLAKFDEGLNPWAVGCYTTMQKVKRRHRQLENEYYMTEKMLTNAHINGLIDYPHEELSLALKDILFSEFHDSLPGSSISEVESYIVQRLDHGLEIISRLKSVAFFRMLTGEPSADENEFPVFVYNPHPFEFNQTVICEFQPPEPNFDKDQFLLPELKDSTGKIVTYQLEKESCNILTDQRKRIVFNASLKASSMTRFSCRLKKVPAEQGRSLKNSQTGLNFKNDKREILIDQKTGLIEKYTVDGTDYLKKGAFKLLVIRDYPDPWGMKVRAFRDIEGEFTLMDRNESADFAGINMSELDPVRIIENGPVRTIAEALFKYNNSAACVRYIITADSSEIEIELRVFWLEKDKMLKLSVPSTFDEGGCIGQVAYGVEEFNRKAEELVAQKWIALLSADNNNALTIINSSTNGFDFDNGEARLSLLRSAAFAAHPVDGEEYIVRQDRFEKRIDQGERVFRFWINAGKADERIGKIDREALLKNEKFMTLCCYPAGTGKMPKQGVFLSDDVVQINALKMAEDNNKLLIIRLFEPTGVKRITKVTVPALDKEIEVEMSSFEIKTIAVDIDTKEHFETDLLERRMEQADDR